MDFCCSLLFPEVHCSGPGSQPCVQWSVMCLQEYLPLGHMRNKRRAAPAAANKKGAAAQAPAQATIAEDKCVDQSSLCMYSISSCCCHGILGA